MASPITMPRDVYGVKAPKPRLVPAKWTSTDVKGHREGIMVIEEVSHTAEGRVGHCAEGPVSIYALYSPAQRGALRP